MLGAKLSSSTSNHGLVMADRERTGPGSQGIMNFETDCEQAPTDYGAVAEQLRKDGVFKEIAPREGPSVGEIFDDAQPRGERGRRIKRDDEPEEPLVGRQALEHEAGYGLLGSTLVEPVDPFTRH